MGRRSEIALQKKGAIKIGPFGSSLSKKEMVGTGFKVYGQENVFNNNFKIGAYFIAPEKYERLKTCTLYKGDVVLTMMGTIGASAIFPENAEVGVMDSHLLRIQPDAGRINSNLLCKQLKESVFIKGQIRKMSQGGIMAGLNASIVKSIKIPIPSISEQNDFCKILESIETNIDSNEIKLFHTKSLKKALMQDLLTGKVRVAV